MKLEGIVGVGPSEEQRTAGKLDIYMCLTSKFFEGGLRWRKAVWGW
jgi:hypothetical protein